jgi:PII-like signaling protein
LVEIVDTAENIERMLPAFDEMINDGMVTVERVQVLTYRASRRSDD